MHTAVEKRMHGFSVIVELLIKEDYGANVHAALVRTMRHLLLQNW